MNARATLLATPPLPLLVDPRAFDGFRWTDSTALEWRCAGDALTRNALDGALPLGLAFVFRAPWPVLPGELARLHVNGRAYDLRDELCLAPYAIDDATDELFAHRRAPHETFWVAADNLNALFWALHDWSHFHNHGPFTERAATELQCDAAALAWLWINRDALPLPEPAWDALRAQVLAAHLALRASEPPGVPCDPSVLADRARLQSLAEALR